MKNKINNSKNFENTLYKLKHIVNDLESGNLSLEKALHQFEKGIKLARLGKKILNDAEQKVKVLTSKDYEEKLENFYKHK